MRRCAALWLALALPASLLAAPFSHVHEAGQASEHVAQHYESGLDLDLHIVGLHHDEHSWTPEADASARSLNAFRPNLTARFVLSVAIVSERFVPAVNLLHQEWVRDSDYRIHDPPRIGTRSPRAPPV
jgi:hypothetical protein